MAETITHKELSEITGMTARWHRELAARGIIPNPKHGVFPREETIRRFKEYERQLADGKEAAGKSDPRLDQETLRCIS